MKRLIILAVFGFLVCSASCQDNKEDEINSNENSETDSSSEKDSKFNSSDSSNTNNGDCSEYPIVEEGFEFERTSNGTRILEVGNIECEIKKTNRFAIYIKEVSKNPMISMGVNSFEPGVYHTKKGSTETVVHWQGAFNASSVDTTESCTIELMEIEYDPVALEELDLNETLPGSFVKVRVKCPERMEYQGSDYHTWSTQTPTCFEVSASNCTI